MVTPEFTPPEPKFGAFFVCYKKPHARTWSANIVLPDGHKENWESDIADKNLSIGRARAYVRNLCKTRGVKTPADIRREAGEPTPWEKRAANAKARAEGKEPPFAPGVGGRTRKDGTPPQRKNGTPTNGHATHAPLVPIVATPDDDMGREWPGFVHRYQEKCVVLVTRITELLILGGGNDPVTFLSNVRALLVDGIEGSIRKPRGRPPGPIA